MKKIKWISTILIIIVTILTTLLYPLTLSLSSYADSPANDGSSLTGDINSDGAVNILDLTTLKLIMLGKMQSDGNSDIDGNGRTNLLDPDALLNSMFGKYSSSNVGGGGGGGGGGGFTTTAPSISTTNVPSISTSTIKRAFAATISPTTTYTEQTQDYTITFTADLRNKNKIGSVSADIPSGFTDVTISSVTASSGFLWSGSITSGQLRLESRNGGEELAAGEYVSVIFSAAAPGSAGIYEWTAKGYEGRGWGGDLFTLLGEQPAVTVSLAPTPNPQCFVAPYSSGWDGGLVHGYTFNCWTVDQNCYLNEIKGLFAPTQNSDIHFYVFQSAGGVDGPYNMLLAEKEITLVPSAGQFRSSGDLGNIPLKAGSYYAIGACWNGQMHYNYGTSNVSRHWGSPTISGNIVKSFYSASAMPPITEPDYLGYPGSDAPAGYGCAGSSGAYAYQLCLVGTGAPTPTPTPTPSGCIIQLEAGWGHTVGLKADGTVIAVGSNDYGQCNVDSWTDIVQISTGEFSTVGLKSDGTVVAVGRNDNGQCNVASWTDIVQVAADAYHTVGLKSDGTVVAVGFNSRGECNVDSWTDIVQISADGLHTVGLKADGTVVAVGFNDYGECNVGSWTDIAQVVAGSTHTIGLKSDGTVVAVGPNNYGQCNVGGWTDIVQVAAGSAYTLGLKADNTVIAVGFNYYDECNVGSWTDIVQVVAGDYHTAGLKSDGTVVAVGRNDNGQCNVASWTLSPCFTPLPTPTPTPLPCGDYFCPSFVWSGSCCDNNQNGQYEIGECSSETAWLYMTGQISWADACAVPTPTPTPTPTPPLPCCGPDAIIDLAIMAEADGGIEWDSIRLTWTAPGPGTNPVDSYEIRRSASAINDGNWDSATICSVTFAPGLKSPGLTQTCTVTSLTEGQAYYFAVKSTLDGFESPVSTTSPSATAQQPDHEVGDWWMYKEYYNSTNGQANKAYFIANIVQTSTSTTVYADKNDTTGTSSGPVAVANKWVDERNVSNGGWGRQRVFPAPVVTFATNTIHHVKLWVTDDDWTQWVSLESLPQSFTTFGTGVFPTTQSYWTGTHTDKVAWSGAQSNGYPYTAGESFGWYEYIHADTTNPSAITHQHFYKDYTWVVGAWVPSYDVSTASLDADARGIGTYGVWPITVNDVWVGGDSHSAVNDPDTISIWYSPDAHNFVRQLDQIRYRGREDSAIVAYEVRDFQVSNMQVSGWDTATLSVSIDVTNTLDETCNFNLLCTLVDTDAVCTADSHNHPYINGDIVYPELSTDPSGTWPYYDAIKQTGNLAPGATTTVSWTISYNTATGPYELWCSGLTATHS